MKKLLCLIALLAGLFVQAQDLTKLDTALKAVCPCTGVSIGNLTDKTTWRVDFLPEATDAQKAAAQAVIDAADPATIFLPPRQWTPNDLLNRFSEGEMDAIQDSADRDVKRMWRRVLAYVVIYPDSPEMSATLDFLISKGLLTATRKTEILK